MSKMFLFWLIQFQFILIEECEKALFTKILYLTCCLFQ